MGNDNLTDNAKKLSFTDKLKMIMAESGWKQSEIARLLGVGQKSVSFWVRGLKTL